MAAKRDAANTQWKVMQQSQQQDRMQQPRGTESDALHPRGPKGK